MQQNVYSTIEMKIIGKYIFSGNQNEYKEEAKNKPLSTRAIKREWFIA